MLRSRFANTGKLAQFIFRLNRIGILFWTIGLVLFTIIMAISFNYLYETQQDRDTIGKAMENPVMTAILGPGEINNYTTGSMTAHQMLLITAIIVSIMAILLVTRNTRADEEKGRLEIIRSLPSGSLSQLNASIIVANGTFTVLAICIGFGLNVLHIESMDLEGSMLYGAVLGGTGFIFTGITAIFAQLSKSSKGTIGLSISVLLLAYLFRAVTDISNGVLSWFSPLGWVSKAEVYSSNNWNPIILMLGISLLLNIVANCLNSIRDLEQGFIASRPGRRFTSRFVQGPVSLTFRLQRTGFISWTICLYILGASYGSIFGDLEIFLGESEMFQHVDATFITEQFISTLMVIFALIATIPPIVSMNKLRAQEKRGYIEHLIGNIGSRARLIGSYLILAAVNSFIMISISALGLWSTATVVIEDGLEFGLVYYAAMVYYPATLVMIGIAAFLIGFFPKLTPLIWLFLVYSLFVNYFGNIIQLPDWTSQLSPYYHIPQVPVEDTAFKPLFLLCVLALLLIIFSFFGYRKRDLIN
ncbi:ABC transporter permease [Ornithinibacillus massiliensis]|uniref:ABC transporter permease n=1 Tax=Ornithinibacillus massiliensis TaxID=1944633 RepID=A0ABS5M8W9_9BACI|nr:ABC transporter permease [Ornithinibacillus massiliensis]MBS3678756.1 ABC transporter permease [Ornithinibacillus massiliensis]